MSPRFALPGATVDSVMLLSSCMCLALLPKPGFDSWGMFAACALLVALGWLCVSTGLNRRTVPFAGPGRLLLIPLAILGGHLFVGQYVTPGSLPLRGDPVVTLAVQLGLMLMFSMFARPILAQSPIGRLGVGIVLLGGVWGTLVQGAGPLGEALWLAGLAALATIGGVFARLRRRFGWACLCMAGLAHVGLGLWGGGASPRTILVSVACVLPTAWPLVRVGRVGRSGACVSVGLAACVGTGVLLICSRGVPWSVLGFADGGLYWTDAANGGILLAFGGGASALAIATALPALVAWRCAVGRMPWSLPAFLVAGAALIWPGGLVSPLVAGVFAVSLAGVPLRDGGRARVYLLPLGVAIVLCLIGLASGGGTMIARARALGLTDKGLHALAGATISFILAWWLGRRRPWLGMVGVLLGALAGIAGEWLQYLFSTRKVEFLDARAHICGGLTAGVLYGLAIARRRAAASGERAGAKLASLGGWLLVLCVASVLVWESWSISRRSDALDAWVVASDMLAPPNSQTELPIFSYRTDLGRGPLLFGRGPRDRQLLGVWVDERTGRPYILKVSPGGSIGFLDVIGRPFGPLAFARDVTVRVAELRPRERVWVTDAETARQCWTDEPDAWRRLVSDCGIEHVVVVHAGPGAAFAEFRRELRERWPDALCVFDPGRSTVEAALRRAIRPLNGHAGDAGEWRLFTSDRSFASAAVSLLRGVGGSVILLGANAPSVSIRQVESLEAYVQTVVGPEENCP